MIQKKLKYSQAVLERTWQNHIHYINEIDIHVQMQKFVRSLFSTFDSQQLEKVLKLLYTISK